MIEKWLPASLKNSENPFYEILLEEADKMIDSFLDQNVRSVKNIYSISNSSIEDLMDIASDIYLLDRNVLKGAFRFLQSQFSTDASLRYSEIVKIVAVFYQLDFTYFSRTVVDPGGYEYIQDGLVISAPTTADFTDTDTFEAMVESYVPGIQVSFEGTPGIIHFIYPVGATDEMKETYPQALMNAACDYALKYEDGFATMLAEDPVAEGWVDYIIDRTTSYEIKVSSDYGRTVSLGEAIRFHVPYCEYTADTEHGLLEIDCSASDNVAIEKFRDEISKIPISLGTRGTYRFYASLFSTLGFNFPGTLTLMKTEDNLSNGRLLDNIELEKHAIDGSLTSIAAVPVNEDFTAEENIADTLDENIGTEQFPEYRTLDNNTLFNRLDMISTSEDTTYKKDIVLGFQLTQKQFNGSSLYPYEYSKFLYEILMLNQKATDVVHVTPILSIDIDKQLMGDSKSITAPDTFVKIYSSLTKYEMLQEYSDLKLKMVAYERSGSNMTEFYNYYLSPADFYWNDSFDVNDRCLTTKTRIEGKRYRLSDIHCTFVSSKEVTCTVPLEYTRYITNHMILKLYTADNEDMNYFVFRQEVSGRFTQEFGITGEDGSFIYDIDVSVSGNTFTFKSTGDFANAVSSYRMNLVSDKPGVQVAKVTMYGEYSNSGTVADAEIWSATFEDKNENPLYIDLPLNVDLLMLVSRHEDI